MEHAVDSSLILRFGLKCLGVFALIFLAAVFTPKMAEYIDKPEKNRTGVILSGQFMNCPPNQRRSRKLQRKKQWFGRSRIKNNDN